MFYWSFTSLVHFWPASMFNHGYAYAIGKRRCDGSVLWDDDGARRASSSVDGWEDGEHPT